MPAVIDRFLDAHPDAAGAGYPAIVRAAGWALALPVIGPRLRLTKRFHAVSQHAGWITLRESPQLGEWQDDGSLTVLSANLWHDWPHQHRWRERLEAVARLVEEQEVDFALLQEVARTRSLRADDWLADRLGMASAYARANGDLDSIGFEEGLAILSRRPIEQVQIRQLGQSRNPLTRRIALAAAIRTRGGRLWVTSVHLALHRDRNAGQLRLLREWITDISQDDLAVIGGDFNAPEDRREIERTQEQWIDAVRTRHPDDPAHTHGGGRWRRGSRRLDYIFLKQPRSQSWRIINAEHRDGPAGAHSDHRAVVTRVAPST